VQHPASALHNAEAYGAVWRGFRGLVKTINQEVVPEDFVDELGQNVDYRRLGVGDEYLIRSLRNYPKLAIDTETTSLRGEPWCLSVSPGPGRGYVVLVEDEDVMEMLRGVMARYRGEVLFHNALYDLPILKKVGIEVEWEWWDSMLAAHILQDLPLNLKSLASGLCGMEMKSFRSLVEGACMDKWDWIATQAWEEVGEVASKKLLNFCKRLSHPAATHADMEARWRKLGLEVSVPLPQGNILDVDVDEAVHYAARDADATYRIWEKLVPRIEAEGVWEMLRIDCNCVPIVADMMEVGMFVNKEMMEEQAEECLMSMAEAEEEVEGFAKKYGFEPEQINIKSTQFLVDLFFDKMGLLPPASERQKGPKRTKKTKRLALDREVLEKMRGSHPIVDTVLTYRDYHKRLSTFIEPVLTRHLQEDGRIHADISMTRAVTGRLASKDPNMLAIPVRTEEGKRLRCCFQARPDCVFVSGDYSQIELRVLAHEAQDETMLECFRTGEDIHARTASILFGLPVEDLDKMKHRYPAKRVNFGMVYGLTPEGLSDNLSQEGCTGWTVDECRKLIEEWFKVFPAVRKRLDQLLSEARRTGCVRDMFGRIRRLEGVWMQDKYMRRKAEVKSRATVIQSGAQGIMKMAMGMMPEVYMQYRREGFVCEPLLQIHDDLLWEVSVECVDEFISELQDVLENAYPLSVPLEVGLSVGDSWGEMVDYE